MHLKRWITGLIALPILIFLVYTGGMAFTLLVSAAAVVALWEYNRIVLDPALAGVSDLIFGWGYVLGAAIVWAAHWMGAELILCLVALNLVVIALVSMFQFKANPAVLRVIVRQLQGNIYIPVLLSFLILIRAGDSGMSWIFLLMAIVFAGDTSAYYVGSYWGRHKLSPAISPGKTIEGSASGLAANLAVGAIGKALFFPGLPWPASIIFSIAVGAAGQIGDLFESEMKRFSGIKDSSNILPGHGGILDRIDALLFASPVAYVFIRFIF
ncbi:MAG: phosphatidate cytidylyltransferase [Desulfobacterales bacterium]|jgi:phosphatidate cytidylyltransferase